MASLRAGAEGRVKPVRIGPFTYYFVNPRAAAEVLLASVTPDSLSLEDREKSRYWRRGSLGDIIIRGCYGTILARHSYRYVVTPRYVGFSDGLLRVYNITALG